MINAWTKAFHAYYRLNFSERKYLYPKKDGETKRRTWDLLECIKKFDGNIADPVKANLMMFIDLWASPKITDTVLSSKTSFL